MRERLTEDLGIDPGHTLQDAHRRVLTQTSAPRVETADSVDNLPPVPLVRPAQLPPDLSSFVGRSAELAILDDPLDMCDHERTHPSGH